MAHANPITISLEAFLVFVAEFDLMFASFDDFWAAMPENTAMTAPVWVAVLEAVVAKAEAHVVAIDASDPGELDPNYWVFVDCASDARGFLRDAKARLELVRPFAAIGAAS